VIYFFLESLLKHAKRATWKASPYCVFYTCYF